MGSKATSKHKTSSKLLLASISVSTAIVVARPAFPSIVEAVTNRYDWAKQEDLTFPGEYGEYTSSALSADGSHLIVGTQYGGENIDETSPLFISSNFGASWQNVAGTVDPDVRNEWSSVDVSNNGQTMVAASDGGIDFVGHSGTDGKIFVSENGGTTWADKSPVDAEDWNRVVVSGDGSKIAAVQWGDDDIYVSEDGGDTWDTIQVQNGSWGYSIWQVKSLAVSDDGNKILVGGEDNSTGNTGAYVSEDDGVNWENVTPNMADGPYSVEPAMSADGNKIAIATRGWVDGGNDAVYYSADDGVNWTDVTPEDANLNEWSSLAMSDNGSTLAVADWQNKMYVSSDAGSNWTEEDPGLAGEDANNWLAVDLNADGTRAVAASPTHVYLSEGSLADNTTVTLSDAEGGKTITLTTPEGTTITCHSAVKESGLSAKDSAYAYPLGLVDFCFSGAEASNEVSLVFVTDLKPNQVVVRKFNPTSKQYTTVSEATVSETTHSGQHALLVSYTITDNGPLDTDPDTGEIADPVGLGVADVAAPDTGLAPAKQTSLPTIASLFATAAVATSLLYRPVRQKIASRIGSKK